MPDLTQQSVTVLGTVIWIAVARKVTTAMIWRLCFRRLGFMVLLPAPSYAQHAAYEAGYRSSLQGEHLATCVSWAQASGWLSAGGHRHGG